MFFSSERIDFISTDFQKGGVEGGLLVESKLDEAVDANNRIFIFSTYNYP
jgi:hypothetical protein